MPDTAAAQLRRILMLIPECADDRSHSIAELARRARTTVPVLLKDVRALSDRFDDPGGFVEAVQIFLEPDRLEVHSAHFLRPMRLTLAEVAALELGLAVLASERPPEEQAAIQGAQERLRKALARLPRDEQADGSGLELPDGVRHAELGPAADPATLAMLRKAYRESRKVGLRYRKADAEHATDRSACPFAILFASGRWYLVAQCDGVEGVRVFRVDRIERVTLLDERYEIPATFQVTEMFKDGRAFASEVEARVRIRFGPRVARWIAEREGGRLEADGSYYQELPLADLDWLVRYVLQYGAEAEVVEPAAARAAVAGRLQAVAAHS